MHKYFVIIVILCAVLSSCKNVSYSGDASAADDLAASILVSSATREVSPSIGRDLPDAPQRQLVHFMQRHTQDTWGRLRSQFSFNVSLEHPRIDKHVNWFKRHPQHLKIVLERAKDYLPYILEQLEDRDLPAELCLLPMVESVYDPHAYSHRNAAGLWQITPITAKQLQLKRSWWYDGRRDIHASTLAAFDYFEYFLKQYEGDWLLALAAYNTGEGNVNKAIRRNNRAGKPTDFWSLRLPSETRSYVPKLLALVKIFKNPSLYGLELPAIEPESQLVKVSLDKQINLAHAAKLAELNESTLTRFNPGFNRWASDPNGPHYLLMPEKNALLFENAYRANTHIASVKWERYQVKSGDTLAGLATRFNINKEQILAANKMANNTLVAGQYILLPRGGVSSSATPVLAQNDPNSESVRKLAYRVKKGDSLSGIASRFNVSLKSIREWNREYQSHSSIKPGDLVTLFVDVNSQG